MLFLKRESLILRKSNGYLNSDKVKKELNFRKLGSFFANFFNCKELLKSHMVVFHSAPAGQYVNSNGLLVCKICSRGATCKPFLF